MAVLIACILGVAGVALFQRPAASGGGGGSAGTVASVASREVRNTFGTAGEFKSESRPARIFIVKNGGPGGVIEGFNAANNDKLRIEGFGLTKPEAVKALMHQEDRDTILALPGGPSIKLLDTSIESLPDANFQLELDRAGLAETFADDFNRFSWYAEGLAPEKDRQGIWRTNYGFGSPASEGSRSMPGQSQVYADRAFRGTSTAPLGLDPFHLGNGILEIHADPAPAEALPYIWGRKYVSGVITSKFSFSQLYGVFEIRARLPKGRGFWPAFWLLPTDGSWPPELDVFEVLGHDTAKLNNAAHSKATGQHTSAGAEIPGPDLSEAFHLYTAEWRKDEIRWYLDGVEVSRTKTPADMQKPMYLLANLGVGGGWPGEPDSSTQFPGIFAIDYIRVYRRPADTAR